MVIAININKNSYNDSYLSILMIIIIIIARMIAINSLVRGGRIIIIIIIIITTAILVAIRSLVRGGRGSHVAPALAAARKPGREGATPHRQGL